VFAGLDGVTHGGKGMRNSGLLAILGCLVLLLSCGNWESTGFQLTGGDHTCLENGFLFTARGQFRDLGREWGDEEDVLHVLFLLPGEWTLGSSWSGTADSLALSVCRQGEDGGQVKSATLCLLGGEHLVVGAARYPLAEGNMFLARWEPEGRLHVEPLQATGREKVAIADRVARFRALRPDDELLQSVTLPFGERR
jgi:hypothetical protein